MALLLAQAQIANRRNVAVRRPHVLSEQFARGGWRANLSSRSFGDLRVISLLPLTPLGRVEGGDALTRCRRERDRRSALRAQCTARVGVSRFPCTHVVSRAACRYPAAGKFVRVARTTRGGNVQRESVTDKMAECLMVQW